MSTFPPPRVDITSKTWPSFADMLLRRWREGGTFGESVFPRPSVTSLGRAGGSPASPPPSPPAFGGAEVTVQLRESDVAYMHFDLRDRGMEA